MPKTLFENLHQIEGILKLSAATNPCKQLDKMKSQFLIFFTTSFGLEVMSIITEFFKLNDKTLGVPDVSYAYEKVKSLTIPDGFKPFKDQFMKIYEN